METIDKDELLEEIEKSRAELHRLIERTSVSDAQVLAKSRELDALHTRYQVMKEEDDDDT